MDSLTQLALGAAVGEATLGRKVGRRALLWGAVCGTLPDLDVFIPLGDAVRDFTYHRGASHSLFVLALLTPLLVWLALKLHPQTREHRRGWLLMVYLVFATHVLLDSFTIYGTQIFWPLLTTPMTWGSIFIIDPLYTLPLLVGIIAALVAGPARRSGHRVNQVGLVLSTLYLAWSLGAKLHVEHSARESLARQGIAYQHLLALPAPFTTLLWRVLAVGDGGYHEGFVSLFDRGPDIRLRTYPSDPGLLAGIEDEWPVRRLQWFTKGFYSVARERTAVVITDLRMGVEPDYTFRFSVGEIGNPHARPLPPEQLAPVRDWQRTRNVWRRIWDEDVTI